jgi:L-aminopeptidase/D-esterase-like protein
MRAPRLSPGPRYVFRPAVTITGTTWIEESGFLEGPIMLTNTASVGTVRDGVILYSIAKRGQPNERDIDLDDFGPFLPVVAETYDGWLNDILGFHVTHRMVKEAIDRAACDNVEEGNVGGGTGMTCYSWKGGIGTASRMAKVYKMAAPTVAWGPADGYTVGVLVQANQGTYWDLVIRGVPVGASLKPPQSPDQRPGGDPGSRREEAARARQARPSRKGRKSSIIVVIATDAPVLPHQLKRLARRGAHGIARTGTITNEDSGELCIAFSTANPNVSVDDEVLPVCMFPNDNMDPLFEATVAATEEAIINALVAAETLKGRGGDHTATAITDMSCPSLVDIMKEYNRWDPPE